MNTRVNINNYTIHVEDFQSSYFKTTTCIIFSFVFYFINKLTKNVKMLQSMELYKMRCFVNNLSCILSYGFIRFFVRQANAP